VAARGVARFVSGGAAADEKSFLPYAAVVTSVWARAAGRTGAAKTCLHLVGRRWRNGCTFMPIRGAWTLTPRNCAAHTHYRHFFAGERVFVLCGAWAQARLLAGGRAGLACAAGLRCVVCCGQDAGAIKAANGLWWLRADLRNATPGNQPYATDLFLCQPAPRSSSTSGAERREHISGALMALQQQQLRASHRAPLPYIFLLDSASRHALRAAASNATCTPACVTRWGASCGIPAAALRNRTAGEHSCIQRRCRVLPPRLYRRRTPASLSLHLSHLAAAGERRRGKRRTAGTGGET